MACAGFAEETTDLIDHERHELDLMSIGIDDRMIELLSDLADLWLGVETSHETLLLVPNFLSGWTESSARPGAGERTGEILIGVHPEAARVRLRQGRRSLRPP
jgi:hypothetical protein